MKVEWRSNNAYDTVLVLEDTGEISQVFSPVADRRVLVDLLTDLGDLADWRGNEDSEGGESPEDYGDLVIERWGDGETYILDAGRLAERMGMWFRP